MHFKLLAALALASVAAATPAKRAECATGPIQCCNSVQSASSNPISSLLGLLGIVVGDITALVGLNCSPISVIGLSGNSW